MQPKIKVVKCRTPDDMNYGGWDMLVALPDGTYSCFAEVMNFNDVLAILQQRAPIDVMERLRKIQGFILEGFG